MSNDTRTPVHKMLGMPVDETPLLPAPRAERMDFGRCRVYAVNTAAEALGLFKVRYGIEATFCVATNIGGAKRIGAWICGYAPEDEDDERK